MLIAKGISNNLIGRKTSPEAHSSADSSHPSRLRTTGEQPESLESIVPQWIQRDDQKMSHASHWVPELLLVGSYLNVDYRIIKLSFAVNNIS
jgi:hypothetical protein